MTRSRVPPGTSSTRCGAGGLTTCALRRVVAWGATGRRAAAPAPGAIRSAPIPAATAAPRHADNLEVSGVRDCVVAARPVYELLGAGDRLAAVYPDCKHEFPPEVR